MYLAIIATVFAELLLYHNKVWGLRRATSMFLLFYLFVVTGILVLTSPTAGTLAVGVVTLIRVINLSRVVVNRFDARRLRLVASRSTAFLCSAQMIIIIVAHLQINLGGLQGVLALATLQAFVALAVFIITVRNLRHSHYIPGKTFYADRELPSVSICIPARNENRQLEECIRYALTSDYPKLEIIVLDDSSHDNTPDIIKQFAHDGVRFVQGDAPDDHWLPKNLAYQRLSEAASGQIILFSSVDIRFSPETVRRIITAMITDKLSMVSIIPQRFTDTIGGAFIQPMRYWWELSLPRRLFSRPPVLSSLWAIKKKELERKGGFAATARSIIPEAYFARRLNAENEYKFIRSDIYLGAQTRKSTHAQLRTTVRQRYAQVHQRLELAFLIAAVELLLILGPFVLISVALMTGLTPLLYISLSAVTLLTATHMAILFVTSPQSVLIGVIGLPIAILTEVYLSLVSVMKYEFSSIDWRGRRIEAKRLEVIPSLPQS